MSRQAKKPEDFIVPLYINGLHGRMLKMPAPKGKNREIMYIQGHHTSLERNLGVAAYLNRYGGVTVPDLPGFGGMDSFYKIGRKPSLDNMADYLAAFIKFRYKNRKFVLTGLSLGFMIVTRMLQKYPKMAKQVEILVSFAGFAHKDDFKYKKSTHYLFRSATWFFSKRLPASFVQHVIFRGPIIRFGYAVFEPLFIKDKNSKIRDADPEEKKRRIDFEVHLWQCNDVRTYMDIAHTMFTLDLTKEHVDKTVNHVSIAGDRYFNNVIVEQHMRMIFSDFVMIKASPSAHAPSVIATPKEAAPYIPEKLRRILNSKTKV